MVQYIFMGDSNLFYQDENYLTLPWRMIYTPQCVATFLATELSVPYYAFPLLRLRMGWENKTRFQSLVQALLSGEDRQLALVLCIGQNDTWSKATSNDMTMPDTCKNYIQYQVTEFIKAINDIHIFHKVYLLDYHDHSSMDSNVIYNELNTFALAQLKSGFTQAIRITMPEITDDMYLDGSHLSRPNQQLVAQHVAACIQRFT